MKIAYLSTSRLPTEKAYGVTVIQSVKAARSLGVDLEIYAPGTRFEQKAEEIEFVPTIRFPWFLRNRAVPGLRTLLFHLNSLLIPFAALGIQKFRSCTHVWMRDPISAFVLSSIAQDKKILLEIHHQPSSFGLSLVRKISEKANVSFAAITPKLVAQIKDDVPDIKVFECPMGVSESFFLPKKPELEKLVLRFLYIGKGESSGFDNGLGVFVKDFARALKTYPKISITFLGLEVRNRELLSQQIAELEVDKSRIIFLDHIPHDQVPTLLDFYDVGVLPYSESKYNNERFPIKSLEYAASELVILASDIDAHKTIIGQSKAFFYKPGQLNSFESQVAEIANNWRLRAEKTASAKKWAQDFTYKKRIQRVMKHWLGISGDSY